MLSGMLFIFLSLLELAVVGFMSRNDGLPPKNKKKTEDSFSWRSVQTSPHMELRQASDYVIERVWYILYVVALQYL